MIIDITYFTGKINLPQIGTTDGNEQVDEFIQTYEPQFLKKLMGYVLWKAFSDGTAGSGTPDQRWIDVLNGKEYKYGGRTYFWPGLTAKPSCIAEYVYYQFQDNKAQDTLLVGEGAAKTDNANRVNPVPKMVAAWNDMVQQTRLFAGFMNANRSTYPEWDNMCEWRTPSSYWESRRGEVYNFKTSLDI